MANATTSIDNLRATCLEALTAHGQLHAQFTAAIASSGDAHCQALVAQLLEQMQQRKTQLCEDIMGNLQELEANNERHKAALDSMRDRFSKIIESDANALQQHVKVIQQELRRLTAISAPDMDQLQQLLAELAYEEELAKQEGELLQQLEQLQQKRAKNTISMGSRVGQLKETHEAVNEQLKLTGNSMQAYAMEGSFLAQSAREELCSQLHAAVLCIDQGVAKCSTLQIQLENLSKESVKQAEQSMQTVRLHEQQMRQMCSASEERAEQLRHEQQKQLRTATENIHKVISDDVKLGHGHDAITADLINKLSIQTKQHAILQRQQLETCHKDLSHFHQSELKTYAPTGTTPSKRDFIYPRTLAATSPHEDIVRRYRQEQDWSDLDTTATIDEVRCELIVHSIWITKFLLLLQCSEGEPEESLQSVQELSETETIMNSTPIDPADGVNMKPRVTRNGANALKPPLVSKRSNSLSTSLTPNKSSSRNSPRNSPLSSPAFNRVSKYVLLNSKAIIITIIFSFFPHSTTKRIWHNKRGLQHRSNKSLIGSCLLYLLVPFYY